MSRGMASKGVGALLAICALCLMSVAEDGKSCREVSGMLMTNFGGFDQATTLGVATGDLAGAVTGTLESVSSGQGGTTVFVVQHHWVTDTGDTLQFAKATATTTQVAPGRYAVLSYPVTLQGGTGRYANASGLINAIGEVDLGLGQTVFRYTGSVCFAHARD